jgi:hypothetical protein
MRLLRAGQRSAPPLNCGVRRHRAVVARPKRKERERRVLESLLRAIDLKASISDRESPDFAFLSDGRLVGVEVTELYHPAKPGEAPLQASANIAAEIVQRAERAHASSGGESLRVSVAFAPHARLQAVRRDEAGHLLLELVQRALDQVSDIVEWRPTYRGDVKYAELFSHVHIYRHPQGIAPHWFVTAAGWIAPLTAELIQARIDEKASRISSYRAAMLELWLVIGVLGRDPSQFFDFDTEDLAGVFRSPFDRTYFVDGSLGRALLLRTAHDA